MIANGGKECVLLMPLCRRRWRQRTDDKRPRLNSKKRNKEGLRKITNTHKEHEGKNECYNRNGTTIGSRKIDPTSPTDRLLLSLETTAFLFFLSSSIYFSNECCCSTSTLVILFFDFFFSLLF
jgi:hypothetical protein